MPTYQEAYVEQKCPRRASANYVKIFAMKLHTLGLLITLAFPLNAFAESAAPPVSITECPAQERAACYAQQAFRMIEQAPEYTHGKLLSMLGLHALATRQPELLEKVIARLELLQVTRSEEFRELLTTLATGGNIEAVKRLLPGIYTCQPHPHSGCIEQTIATSVALIVMKQLLAKAQAEQALDNAFLALRYNGGIEPNSTPNSRASAEFYNLITSLDYLPRFKKELEAVYAEPISQSQAYLNPKEYTANWSRAQKIYRYREHINRLLLIPFYDPAQLEKA